MCSRFRSKLHNRTSTGKVLAALSSKTILLGVLDLADMTVEAPAIVADRIRRALPYVEANKSS